MSLMDDFMSKDVDGSDGNIFKTDLQENMGE